MGDEMPKNKKKRNGEIKLTNGRMDSGRRKNINTAIIDREKLKG